MEKKEGKKINYVQTSIIIYDEQKLFEKDNFVHEDT